LEVNPLPIFLNVADRPCLVVGAGAVATRKVELLLEAGARVTVVAQDIGPEVRRLADAGRLRVKVGPFEEADLEGQQLAIAATGNPSVNRRVAAAAGQRGTWVNVVDSPSLCSFHVPAIVRRPPLTVAIGTGGAAPTLAGLVRAKIEALLPTNYGLLAQLAESWRKRVQERLPRLADRRRFWQRALSGTPAELAMQGRTEQAERALLGQLNSAAAAEPQRGSVSLVGAGPGDPGLLTLRAWAELQEADVVVHDRLVSPAVLACARREAERLDVGKAAGAHTCGQTAIHRILIEGARAGKRMVRLQGGDPLLFGRGGEELQALAEAGIPVRVVPGITAALGCSAYAGIPLTHRDCAQSCVLVTGHLRRHGAPLDWPRLAAPRQTVVFYMGLAALPEIVRELIAHGAPATRPGALVAQGTTAEQRVVAGTLEALPALAESCQLQAPTLVIVGDVVRLRVPPEAGALDAPGSAGWMSGGSAPFDVAARVTPVHLAGTAV
jgi:uroporphyrin-III C-methyltransferase/precorrin-2 dehydrogenase/sirohydrochlorin ferrochelatase